MKLLRIFASQFRPGFVFRILSATHDWRVFGGLARLYDPNTIRRKIDVDLPEKLAVFDKGSFKLLVNLNEHIGYWTYLRQVPFEQTVYHLARAMNLGPEDTILDIGANIGVASIPLCAERGCELVAVEASKNNAALLLKNAALNNVQMRTHVLALTSPEQAGGYMPLYIKKGNLGANSLIAEWSPSKGNQASEMVPTSTLDDLIGDEDLIRRIAIVKIDVEGAEWQVLQGARDFLRRNTAPILMEYRLDVMSEFLGSDLSHVVELMSEHYDLFGLEDGAREVPFDAAASYENILFRRKRS